jgi:invasion protein IalB
MKKSSLPLAAAMLVMLPYATLTVSAQEPQAQTQQTAKSEDDKVVCRSDNPTGTRVGNKKVCKTKAEWVEFTRQQREEAQRVQTDALNQRMQSGN